MKPFRSTAAAIYFASLCAMIILGVLWALLCELGGRVRDFILWVADGEL